MLLIPFLVLIVMAILFPNFTRFLIFCTVLGVLLVASSCIDHAKAADFTDFMRNNTISFSNCTYGEAVGHKGELRQIKIMGGNSAAILALSCAPLIDPYIHYCVEFGHTEDQCYGDIRQMAADALIRAGIND